VFSLWEISPQLQRFEASQYEPPGQKEMGMPQTEHKYDLSSGIS
jgi:hypothetical protein